MFCSTKPLGKGARCAPPLHPPGHGFDEALSHSKPKNVSPFHHSQGNFALPAPNDLEGVPAPKTPAHFMETTSPRPKEGSFRATLPWNHPIDQRACHTPWNPDQPCADWMPNRAFAPRYPRPFHGDHSPPIGCPHRLKMDTVALALHWTLFREPTRAMVRKRLHICVSIGYTFLAMKDVGLRIRVQRELREQFIAACKAEDKPAAQVLREFMRDYVSQNGSAPANDAATPNEQKVSERKKA